MRNLIHSLRRLDERIQEYRLNIHTSEWHDVIDPANPERRGYSPTSYVDWRIIARQLRPVDRSTTFIDYGAGLGRIAILAGRLGFKQVIGIELSEDLAAKGRANIRAAQAHLRSPVSIMIADATAFEPPVDSSVLFFHNPFAGSILQGALEKIKTSSTANPRPLRLVCNLPFESAFEAEIWRHQWLTLVSKHDLYDQRKCLIFSCGNAQEI